MAFLITRAVKRAVAAILARLTSLREHDTTGLRAAMDRMAQGDLTATVEPVTEPIASWSNDELGDVAQAVNAVRDNTIASVESYNLSREALAAMIGQVAGTASTVSSASTQEIAASAQQLAHAASAWRRWSRSSRCARRRPAPIVVAVQQTATAKGLPGLGRVPPMALVLSGVTSIQFGAAIAATLFGDLGPAGVSALRLGWAAIILMALFRPHVRGRPAADLRLVLLFGLVLGAMNLCFYEALDRIPLGVAVTIEFAGPLGVAVFASHHRRDLVWAALAAVGIVLLGNPFGAGLDTVGLILILTAAACWAAYILIAQRATSAFESSEGVALAAVIAALVPLGPGIAQAGADLVQPKWLALGACVALLSSVIPYSLETESLRRLPAHVFGVLMSIEPAVAALAGFLILGQSLNARELVAMGLVVVASVGSSRTAAATPEA